jgi:hypothetical protein
MILHDTILYAGGLLMGWFLTKRKYKPKLEFAHQVLLRACNEAGFRKGQISSMTCELALHAIRRKK